MYILLTPKMKTKIRETDEWYFGHKQGWRRVGKNVAVGEVYDKTCRPIRRKSPVPDKIWEVC